MAAHQAVGNGKKKAESRSVVTRIPAQLVVLTLTPKRVGGNCMVEGGWVSCDDLSAGGAMKRAGLLSIAFFVLACSSGGQPGGTTPAGAASAAGQPSAGAASAAGQPSPGPTQAAGGGGDAGGSLLDKAKAVQHFCNLLPADLVSGIIDSPTPPQEEQFPPRCSVYGGKTAMEFSLDAFNTLGDPPAGARTISGVGAGAYLENLSAGNFYLSVGLSPEGGVLHVEVNNGDGKDHTDEVVSLANAILKKIGG